MKKRHKPHRTSDLEREVLAEMERIESSGEPVPYSPWIEKAAAEIAKSMGSQHRAHVKQNISAADMLYVRVLMAIAMFDECKPEADSWEAMLLGHLIGSAEDYERSRSLETR